MAFDPDTATCWLDRLNRSSHFRAENDALAGGAVSVAFASPGFDLIRRISASGRQVDLRPFDSVDFPGLDPSSAQALYLESLVAQLNTRFALDFSEIVTPTHSVVHRIIPVVPPVPPPSQTNLLLIQEILALRVEVRLASFSNLTFPQRALLGCGPAFGSGCDLFGASLLKLNQLARSASPPPPLRAGGGVDRMNSDASVWTQETVRLKALSPGAPVGLRVAESGEHEAGISTAPHPTQTLSGGRATDAAVEPFPWPLAPEQPDGRIRFVDPRTAPTRVPGGENCTPLFGGPDPGCTALEVISANAERLAMVGDTLGADHAFDPPETAAEVLAMTDEDPSNDATGDPLAGPDGIVFANWIEHVRRSSSNQKLGLYDFRSDGELDAIRIDLSNYQRAIVADAAHHLLIAADFKSCVAFLAADPLRACFKALSDPIPDPNSPDAYRPRIRQVVGALPLAVTLLEVLPGGSRAPVVVVLQELAPLELQALASVTRHGGRNVVFDAQIPFIETDSSDPDFGRLARNDAIAVAERRPATLLITDRRGRVAVPIDLARADFDLDLAPHLDPNGDFRLDFLDDGTPGPVADDAITCGTGIPGDPLFDALQVETSDVERSVLVAKAGPLPSCAPSGCPSVLRQEGVLVVGSQGQRHWSWHAGSATPDADADGIGDDLDDCPFISDPDQTDRGGLGHGSGPDGVWEACQWGDVTGDGSVDLSDLVVMRRALGGLEPNPGLRAPERRRAPASARALAICELVKSRQQPMLTRIRAGDAGVR